MSSRSTGGFRNVLRALVRQLATAVYAIVVFSFLSRLAPNASLAGVVIEAAVVFAAAALLARLVDGPFWTVAWVGPFVAGLNLSLILLGQPEGPMSVVGWPLFFVTLPPLAAGLGGAWVARRLKNSSSPDASAS